MANIISFPRPQINISLSGIGLESPIEIEMNYTVRFTPLEALLANYGLYFREKIEIFEVAQNAPHVPINPTYVYSSFSVIPSSEIISTVNFSPSLRLNRVFSEIISQSIINVDPVNDSPNVPSERIRARITLYPVPIEPMEVKGATMLSRVEVFNLADFINP